MKMKKLILVFRRKLIVLILKSPYLHEKLRWFIGAYRVNLFRIQEKFMPNKIEERTIQHMSRRTRQVYMKIKQEESRRMQVGS